MSATSIHAMGLGVGLLFLGALFYAVKKIRSVGQQERYRLFWYVPYATASAMMSGMFLTVAFSYVDAYGCSYEPTWVDKLVDYSFPLFLVGLLLQRVAPKGQLLPNFQSLAVCAAGVVLSLAYSNIVPHAFQHDVGMAGVFMLIWFGNKPRNRVA